MNKHKVFLKKENINEDCYYSLDYLNGDVILDSKKTIVDSFGAYMIVVCGYVAILIA